jgi:hypothetical protein
MRARRMLLATVVAAGALGGASVATEGCGTSPTVFDGAALDASVDGGDACSGDPFSCFDAQLDFDGSGVQQVDCPDGGYFITIDGDGVTQTLSSGSYGGPVATLIDCCGTVALAINGSKTPDGGGSVSLEQACSIEPDGGLTFHSGPDYVVYVRSDGTTFFTSGLDASLTTAYTAMGPPGTVVSGSYAVTVATPDAATLSLSGTFFTCRMPDAICVCPPPPGP